MVLNQGQIPTRERFENFVKGEGVLYFVVLRKRYVPILCIMPNASTFYFSYRVAMHRMDR